jgi:hypothetical protein
MQLPRLRQVVLAVRDLEEVTRQVEAELGVSDPFHDPGVGHFGLRNAVYAVGDCFLEVLSPVQPDTAAGRQLDRHGGDCGYMAMFELTDAPAVRERIQEAGVRVVWDTAHDDIVDLHLHPKDVPGAIVALDITHPFGSWRWGGPAWTGQIRAHGAGGWASMTVAVADPEAAATRWAAVLGVEADGAALPALHGGQQVFFTEAANSAVDGIVAVHVDVPEGVPTGSVRIAGVDFDRSAAKE